MGDVISFDPFTTVINDDVPPHMDRFGQMMLLCALSDLVKLRDNAANEHSRTQVDSIVQRISKLLARYEPEGAA